MNKETIKVIKNLANAIAIALPKETRRKIFLDLAAMHSPKSSAVRKLKDSEIALCVYFNCYLLRDDVI
jgi:hypothetical protein